MRRLTLALATLPIVALQLTAGPARAACQVDTVPVAFGIVDVTRTTDTTGEITLSCSITTDVEVALEGSSAPGQRSMAGPGGARLTYELYTDASRSQAWGDGGGNSATRSANSVGEDTRRLTIYGRVPRQDAVPAGAYSDSLTVVVSFQ